jgi:hypothetical protein
MTTEIPRTIQLISVALSIAALAIIPGSELAAAQKDTNSHQTDQREKATPQSWTWKDREPSQPGFCIPNITNDNTKDGCNYDTITRCIYECQRVYYQGQPICTEEYQKCKNPGINPEDTCATIRSMCERRITTRAQECRVNLNQ